MKISTILDHIDQGTIALPEFQRGFVWNRDQVRLLMGSLYRKHPVGSLLVWVTKSEAATVRGSGTEVPGSIQLLLDGQQRMTSLYGIMRGKPPRFFDGNALAFTGLYFDLEEEVFEFYAPVKMKDNPLWINVTELIQTGLGSTLIRLMSLPKFQEHKEIYINRLNNIETVKEIDLHVEQVTGEDKTVDVVVDIFNRVNSGGTKLSKGDLALAKICAEWPEARQEMKIRLHKWRQNGFNFRLELLLRCITTDLTGEAMFSALKDVTAEQFQNGLKKTEKLLDSCLNLVSSRLGLDHDRVLGSRYSLPILTRYFSQKGGKVSDPKERDRLLYWYVHTFLWGRYAGATETVLNQDLQAIKDIDSGLDKLTENLRQSRGDLRIQAKDFSGWSAGARFYPVLYMLTRVWHARDFESGLDLTHHLLGHGSSLELHHIFPKAQLYKAGFKISEVNALANFTFLTKETNQAISDQLPEEYLARYAAKDDGLIESHWIPNDPSLWKIESYRKFLDARRLLLAKSTNEFLDQLAGGKMPEVEPEQVVVVEARVAETAEDAALRECNEWVESQGLPGGEFNIEVLDEKTGQFGALIDLGWPNGLQEGLSQPVALLLNEDEDTEKAVNQAGYRFFTAVDQFQGYVQREILG